MDGTSYLRWDNFRATTIYQFLIWFRPYSSGYIFNHNYETRPFNVDRDECDNFDDDYLLHGRMGEFNFYFDECKAEDNHWPNLLGWHMLQVKATKADPY